jgi:hypothetical protein
MLVWGVLACSMSPTGLIALPTVELLDLPEGPGQPVLVRVVNTTESDVTLLEPACTAHVIELVGEQWRRAEAALPCASVDQQLAPGASHPFSVDTPAGRSGRFRVVVLGSNAHGDFEARSGTFTVE